jgi:internalin A
MTELAKKLIEKEREIRSGYLDLGRCGLREMPDLSDMDWLETLILSDEWWDVEQKKWIGSPNKGSENSLTSSRTHYFPLRLKKLILGSGSGENWGISDWLFLHKLTNLQTLDLSANPISDWSFLGKLINLQTLDLSFNQISDWSFLVNLTNLQTLYLRSNQINDWSFLVNLTRLQALDLSFNQINDLSFLVNLANLQMLDLSYNQISNVSFLSYLTNLQTLDLGYNQIGDVSFLGNLTNLQILYLCENEIRDISFLGNLPNLHTIILNENEIRDVSFLGALIHLQTLNLSKNEVSDVSSLVNLTRLQTLEISNNQISDVSFLNNLTRLEMLDLRSNNISDVSFISNLARLEMLDLRSNKIRDVSFLSNLTNLQTLYLRSNNISDVSFISNLTNLQILDISYNQISDMSFLSYLTNLETLDLRSNKISDVSFLGHLTSLQTLNLSFNQISDVSLLNHLTNLQTLDLRYNRIVEVPFLDKMMDLQTLYFGFNQISDVSFLSTLSGLTTLDLCSNRIIDVSFLSTLSGLTTLSLSSNQISDVSFLLALRDLTMLDLSNNQISDVSFLSTLSGLTTLDLSSNQISNVSSLSTLSGLTTLDLSSNQISNVSSLSTLSSLTSLSLSSNRISDVSFLSTLSGLTTLYLGSNQINDVSFLSTLSGLKALYLGFNEIIDGSFLEKLPKLQSLDISSNPLTNTPNIIVPNGNKFILEYFRQKVKTGAVPLLEAKLILLGDGRAGKTSLSNRLLGKPLPKDEDRTMGVDIIIGDYGFDVAEGRRFKLHIWDFAGQDKYKPLHQFFYTEDAVYVMVADSGNAGTDYDDWLQTAQLFGTGSPLLMALNEFRTGMGNVFDAEYWKKRFPFLLKEVHLVNLLTQKGVSELEKDIQLFAQRLPHTAQVYPKNWAAIRQELERRRDENFIPWSEYLRICRDNDLPERESALILSRILHTIGVCLHYEKNSLLQQHVILKNEWATDAVYLVLEDHIVVEEKKGFFDWSDLQRIWSHEAYQDMCPQLLELMRYFKLAYPLPNNKEYVTPPLLPPAPPSGWEMPKGESLELLIEYEFLPKTLMAQFIVQRHADIDQGRKLVWRNGVVLRWPDALAEVIKTKSQGRDAFAVQVQGHNRKGLLTYILKTIHDLHAEYKGIRASEIVPCPCKGCRTATNKPHFFDLENLKNRFEKGRHVVECDKSLEEVPLQYLLDNLFLFEHLSAGHPLVWKTILPPIFEKTTILMLTANPSGTTKLNLDKEHARIAEKIQSKQDQFSLTVQRAVDNIQFKEFTETFNPRILHFSGHGEEGEHGGIIVQNEEKNGSTMISPKSLDVLFEYFIGEGIDINAVVLNACYSEDQALAISKHVPYVVCTTAAIEDTFAIAFSVGFYFKLTNTNLDFEQAYKSGRAQAVISGAGKSHFILYKNNLKLEI